MAIYAIGDVQGCFRSLTALLATVGFDPARDRLWLVGNLVNRGPRSLETLRWIHAQRAHVTVVLGNHDLRLLELAVVKRRGDLGTLGPILRAEDRTTLTDWLRQQPLIHQEDGWLMVHAGLLPAWSIEEAVRRARRAEEVLRSDCLPQLLAREQPANADADLIEARETVSVLTRLRMVGRDGRPRYAHKGPPDSAPAGELAWFEAAGLRHERARGILFGHWAALGRYLAPPYFALDSGCAWGLELTAYRLDDGAIFTQRNVD